MIISYLLLSSGTSLYLPYLAEDGAVFYFNEKEHRSYWKGALSPSHYHVGDRTSTCPATALPCSGEEAPPSSASSPFTCALGPLVLSYLVRDLLCSFPFLQHDLWIIPTNPANILQYLSSEKEKKQRQICESKFNIPTRSSSISLLVLRIRSSQKEYGKAEDSCLEEHPSSSLVGHPRL